MFKMFVSKAVKAAWENLDSAPAAQSSTEPVHIQHITQADEELVPITPHALGIDLPYYPGQGTACGSACRCRWQIDMQWSNKHAGNAVYATWQTSGDGTVCTDCQDRSRAWQHEFICVLPG